MLKEHSLLHAMLWAAAILASALLHGPLDLTLILTLLANAAIVTADRPTDCSA